MHYAALQAAQVVQSRRMLTFVGITQEYIKVYILKSPNIWHNKI